jgi:conserved domain protein
MGHGKYNLLNIRKMLILKDKEEHMQSDNYTQEMFANYPDVVDVSGLQSMLGNIGKQKAYELVREGTIKAIKVGKLYRIPKINVIAFLTQ